MGSICAASMSTAGVEGGAGIACARVRQRASAASQSAPCGCARFAFQISESDFVRRDHAGARAGLDRHIAHGHALIHRQRANGRAAIFQHMAGAARDADLADDGEDQILGGHAGPQSALDIDRKGLRLALQQRLGREHMTRPRWCRCRRRARRRRRACWCGCRRRRWSCRAACTPIPG